MALGQIELFRFLGPTKGNPVIDLIHRLSNRMIPGAKHLQLLALMGEKVIDFDC